MQITVNKESREVGSTNVASLLAELRYSFPLLIIRVNGHLVERRDYGAAPVAEGDVLDIYHLVSGG